MLWLLLANASPLFFVCSLPYHQGIMSSAIEIDVSPPFKDGLKPATGQPPKKYTYAVKAYKNPDFLNSNHARFIRVMCEYEVS